MKSRGTHILRHLHTLPFLRGERSVSRGGNCEPLLWLITWQGPGRTQCHFHCQTHYTAEEDSPPLLSCPFSPAVMWRNPSTACRDELRVGHVEVESQVKYAEHTQCFSCYTICYSGSMHNSATRKEQLEIQKRHFKWMAQQFSLEILAILTVNLYIQQWGGLPKQLKYYKIEVL